MFGFGRNTGMGVADNQKRRMRNVNMLMLAALFVVFVLALFRMWSDEPPGVVELWAEGRYEMPRTLIAEGLMHVDASFTDPARQDYYAEFFF